MLCEAENDTPRTLPDEEGPRYAEARAILDKLHAQYPLVGRSRITYQDYNEHSLARKGGNKTVGFNVELNRNHWGDDKFWQEHPQKAGSYYVNATQAGVLVHEYGHLMYQAVEDTIGMKAAQTIIQGVYGTDRADLHGVSNLDVPSAMALENVWELMAEAFSARHFNYRYWSMDQDAAEEAYRKAKLVWDRLEAAVEHKLHAAGYSS